MKIVAILIFSMIFNIQAQEMRFYGLDELRLELLDQWTNQLITQENQDNRIIESQDIERSFLTFYLEHANLNDFYKSIINKNFAQGRYNVSSYQDLALTLLKIRTKIQQFKEDSIYKRKVLILLQYLADETLYVMKRKFQNAPTFFQIDYQKNTDACPLNGLDFPRSKESNSKTFKTCQGDIWLSKGGAASSSFLARIANLPGNFSHSTVPWITQIGDFKKIYLVEAEIEDGVKLRDPQKDYITSRKTKLSIYRSKDSQVVKKGIEGVEDLIEQMKEKVGGSIENLITLPSFPYDFAMNSMDPNELFCSEVAYWTYHFGNASNEENPYPTSYWSQASQSNRDFLLGEFMKTTTEFPAPSDVENNPSFELVYQEFDLDKFQKDRIMVAFIDILLATITSNDATILKMVAQKVEKIGGVKVKKDELKAFLVAIKSKLPRLEIPQRFIDSIDTLPEGINVNQLVFFSIVNYYLEKEILAAVVDIENQSKNSILSQVAMRSLIQTILLNKIETVKQILEQL